MGMDAGAGSVCDTFELVGAGFCAHCRTPIGTQRRDRRVDNNQGMAEKQNNKKIDPDDRESDCGLHHWFLSAVFACFVYKSWIAVGTKPIFSAANIQKVDTKPVSVV